MTSNLDKALQVVDELMLPVFPCRPVAEGTNGTQRGAKSPYIAGGFHAASTDHAQILQWWSQWPDALIGVPTGSVTGLLVIDIDPNGMDWYRANAERLGCGCVHRTPRGFHLLSKMPADLDITSNASQIAPGVDLRANGGYVIWWPAHGYEATGSLVDLTQATNDSIQFATRPGPAITHARPVAKPNSDASVDLAERNARLAVNVRSITTAAPGMHDGLRNVAAKLVANGTSPRFATDLLTQMAHDDGTPRTRERISEIPRLVASAVAKGYAPGDENAEKDDLRAAPMNWPELLGDPPPRMWWIQDWLTPSPTLCAGRGGIGKSLLLQALCTGLATGRGYLDQGGRALRCLVWFCEDDHDEIWRRQNAVNRYFGVGMTALTGLHIVPRVGRENTLMALVYGQPTFTALLTELREQVNDLNADVLVLDNMAQVFGGMSADSHQVTKFVNGVSGIVTGRPFAPIFTGHVARSEGSEFMGSAAWENACRMRWFVGSKLPDQEQGDESADPDTIYLARRKANYTVKDYRRLRYSGGLFVPDAREDGTPATEASRAADAEMTLLQGMSKLKGMGINITDASNSPDNVVKQIEAKGLAQGQTRRDLKAAVNRLMSAGRLKRVEIGKYSNRSPRMGLVEVQR